MMRVLATLFLLLALLLALWIGWAKSTERQRPTEAVKETIARLRQILKEPELKGQAKKNLRREELKRVIWSRFDLEEFSRRSLGRYWPKDPQKQREFMALFKTLLENIYLEKAEQLDDSVIIVYRQEQIDGDYGEVDTLIRGKGDLKVDYKVKLLREEWRVYDLAIEDVSIVSNYRSQFHRRLFGKSFDDLLDEMRKKVDEINSKER